MVAGRREAPVERLMPLGIGLPCRQQEQCGNMMVVGIPPGSGKVFLGGERQGGGKTGQEKRVTEDGLARPGVCMQTAAEAAAES